jgi:hypothetical protein
MAVQSTLAKSTLSLKYVAGIDETGKEINKFKRFSNVKTAALDQGIYDTAAALNPLLKYPVAEVVRTNDSVLINA